MDWHNRLAHPSDRTFNFLLSSKALSCNKRESSQLCSSCLFGKQIKLPFAQSNTTVDNPFDIIHSNIWTSPVPSNSGIKFYILFLDHYSHFLWVYPLRNKHETFSKFLHFTNYVKNSVWQEHKIVSVRQWMRV